MFAPDHEVVCYCHDANSGLLAIIAIHTLKRGPALGGTRVFPYHSEGEALADVLELSRAMTYKAVAAELPFGGAKAVIIADPAAADKRLKLAAFCRYLNLLEGHFQTGEDVGTDPDDILYMRQFTQYAHCSLPGSPEHMETSALTARGVISGIKASMQHRFGSSVLKGRRFGIQGLGKVGSKVANLLAGEGAKLVVADVNHAIANQLRTQLGCEVVHPDVIFEVEADVFVPCAVGHILSPDTVARMKAAIVAGSANNQLTDPTVADLMNVHNILYAPDFVINAGGLISAMLEMALEDEETVLARVDAIGDRLSIFYKSADSESVSPLTIANRFVEQKLLLEQP